MGLFVFMLLEIKFVLQYKISNLLYLMGFGLFLCLVKPLFWGEFLEK